MSIARRRRFQFGLSSLLWLTAGAAVVCAVLRVVSLELALAAVAFAIFDITIIRFIRRRVDRMQRRG